jgi:hypothetical protein
MTAQQAWNIIFDKLSGNRTDFPTAPITKKTPIWFSAIVDGEIILIDNAINHQPSSKLKVPRKLKYRTFQKIYPLYLRRENGEQISAEAKSLTVNQVYYFSLIKNLCQEKEAIGKHSR